MKVTQHITRLATAALIAGAVAAPAAHALPAPPDSQPAERVVVEPAPPVVQSVDSGFDWASAAIGAGAARGLILRIGALSPTRARRFARPPRPSFGGRAGEHANPPRSPRPSEPAPPLEPARRAHVATGGQGVGSGWALSTTAPADHVGI